MIQKYQLCRLLKKKSKKTGKEYCYAHLVYFMPEDTQLLKIYITDNQYDALSKVPKDFNINEFVEIEYNSYHNAYEPIITYGL